MAVLSTGLMFVDHHEKHLQGFREAIGTLVTPILYLADLPQEFFSWGGENLMSRSQLRKENAQLRDESLILKARQQKYVALQAENSRLRNLLGSERANLDRRLVAEMVEVESDAGRLQFVINKGSNHDLFVGQPVIDAYGIIGQVIDVSFLSARVLMITDADHAIPVRVSRNGVRSIALGTGRIDTLELQHVPDTSDIKVGDLLLSSGLGKRFPDGYPVATVTSVVHNPGAPFAKITAKTIAHMDRSSMVLLLWSLPADKPSGSGRGR